jgi:protease I
VLSIVREFRDRGKWVFGICHGVQVLASAGLVGGAKATAYEHCRTDVELGGGTYVADQQAVRDGRMVTGQTWQSHPEFYREVMACLAAVRPPAEAMSAVSSSAAAVASGV